MYTLYFNKNKTLILTLSDYAIVYIFVVLMSDFKSCSDI